MLRKTLKKESSEEIEQILSGQTNFFYKEWQLSKGFVHSLKLDTTYDEMFAILTEQAMYRPYWEVTEDLITLPTIFAKINGTELQMKNYWKNIHKVLSQEKILLYQNSSLCNRKLLDFQKEKFNSHSSKLKVTKVIRSEKDIISVNYQKHINSLWESQNSLLELWEDIKNGEQVDFKNLDFWCYKGLPINIQEQIEKGIHSVIQQNQLYIHRNEQKESVLFALLFLSEKIINTYKDFDYPYSVPKIIIYNKSKHKTSSIEDAAIMLLLNKLGFDIVVLSPSKTADLEYLIKESNFVLYQRPTRRAKLPFKDLSKRVRFMNKFKGVGL